MKISDAMLVMPAVYGYLHDVQQHSEFAGRRDWEKVGDGRLHGDVNADLLQAFDHVDNRSQLGACLYNQPSMHSIIREHSK